MFDVRNILKRKPAKPATARAQLVEEPIPARNTVLIGRTVAIMPDDTSVRMATVRHWGTRRTVIDAREVLTPQTDDDAVKRSGFIQRTIQEYVDHFGKRGAVVRLAVAGKETAFRSFHMPLLKASDLREAVKLEAGRQLPFPVAEGTIDFRPVGRIFSGDQGRYRIALHAATQRRIRQVMQPFDDLGLSVQSILHSHDVVGQILPSLPDYNPTDLYTILTIGTHFSEIAFYRGATLEFFHQTNTGAAMAGDLSDPTRREFLAETLATDIQTSFDYFAGQHATSSTPTVHVCGAPGKDDTFVADLENRVGMRCKRFPVESLRGISFADSDAQSASVVMLPVVAAALNTARVADLLPEPSKLKRRNQRVDRIGRAAVVAVAVVLASAWGMQHRQVQIERENARALKAEVAMIESSNAYQAFRQLQGQLATSSAYIQETEKQPTYLALNLKALSHLVPKGLRLTRYDLAAGAGSFTNDLRIYGVVVADEIPPEVTLAEFVEQLAGSSFYDSVQVERYVKRERDGEFTIDFQLAMKGVI